MVLLDLASQTSIKVDQSSRTLGVVMAASPNRATEGWKTARSGVRGRAAHELAAHSTALVLWQNTKRGHIERVVVWDGHGQSNEVRTMVECQEPLAIINVMEAAQHF